MVNPEQLGAFAYFRWRDEIRHMNRLEIQRKRIERKLAKAKKRIKPKPFSLGPQLYYNKNPERDFLGIP